MTADVADLPDAARPPVPDAEPVPEHAFACAGPQGRQSLGILLTPRTWIGFRFQVPDAGAHLVRAGLEYQNSLGRLGEPGTLFAVVVPFSGVGPLPTRQEILAQEILARTLLEVRAIPTDETRITTGPMDGWLAGGNYLAVFGIGAFEATLPEEVGLPSGGIDGCVLEGMPALPIGLVDDTAVYQAATVHLFLDAEP